MTETVTPHAIGSPVSRLDGPIKVTGSAPFAYEHPVDNPGYLHPIQATIARGRVLRMDTAAAQAVDGVLAVLTPDNALPLADTSDSELAILQDGTVAFRGQLIGAVLAETPEVARHAQSLVRVEYETEPHDTELRFDHPDRYAPERVNGGFSTEESRGDVIGAVAAAPVTIDRVYRTAMEHNQPMEPHTCIAVWDDNTEPRLTLFDSTQGPHTVRSSLAPILGLDPEQIRVVAPYVGGGFGSKGKPHAHNVLAAMAARLTPARPVKLALTRQQMFSLVGYRTPTIQRLRFAAGGDARLRAVSHDAIGQTARYTEFAEQTAVPSRMMYAGSHRHSAHQLVALDVPVPYWMRAPGECPGMFALEVAMDELAEACGLDPIEVRIRNEPEIDPETSKPWSSRRLTECLRQGADRIGWEYRGPGTRRDGDWHVGIGIAASTYPAFAMPGSRARVEYLGDGRYAVGIGAADIGTGTWTALAQIAADALECPLSAVSLQIGDTDLPRASVEGGSTGITSWGSTVVAAAREFRRQHGGQPQPGAAADSGMPEPSPESAEYSSHSFGAMFAEVRVHAATGEIRVPWMLGVFSVGRVINPKTARSQLIGGMTMGLGMALHERSVLDPNTGHVVNHDFAEYHIPTSADVADLEAIWLDEGDPHANPMGSRGVGEIGIVGSPAAIANAYYNATGIRVRDLPITSDVLFTATGSPIQ